MWKPVLPAIAISVLLSIPQALSQDLSLDDLLGRWCGSESDYTFTESKLVVSFHNGQPERTLEIQRVESTPRDIEVIWEPPYKNTIFEKFTPDKRSMRQAATRDGSGPVRFFRRC